MYLYLVRRSFRGIPVGELVWTPCWPRSMPLRTLWDAPAGCNTSWRSSDRASYVNYTPDLRFVIHTDLMLLTLWIPWDPYILTHYPRAGHSDNAGLMMAWRTTSYVECIARDDLQNVREHLATFLNSVLTLTTFSRVAFTKFTGYRKIFQKLVDLDDLEIIKKSSFLRFWVIPGGVEKTLIFTPPGT